MALAKVARETRIAQREISCHSGYTRLIILLKHYITPKEGDSVTTIEWIIFFVSLCVLCVLIRFIIAPKMGDTDEEARKKVRERLYKALGKIKKKEENDRS